MAIDPYSGLRGLGRKLASFAKDEVDAAKAIPGQLRDNAQQFARTPLETGAAALAPLGPEFNALGATANGVRSLQAVTAGEKAARASPFLANTVRAVVNSKAVQAGARVVPEATSRLAKVGTGLRDAVVGGGALTAAGAALPYAQQSAAQGHAAAEGLPPPPPIAAPAPAVAVNPNQKTAPAAGGGAAGSTGAVANPANLREFGIIQKGRDKDGHVVASNSTFDGSSYNDAVKLGAQAKGLRAISFDKETPADVKKASDASEAYYKNIGGNLETQKNALRQALEDQAGGTNAAERGLRSKGAGGAADSPVDQFKALLEQQKFEHEKGKDASDAAAKTAEEQRKRADARAATYLGQVDPKKAKPADTGDSQLLADLDRLQEGNANLYDENDPATAPTRENLRQRVADLINQHYTRYTSFGEPSKPIAPQVGNTDLSGFKRDSYKGGWQQFVPDTINNFGGSFAYTGPDGNQYNANADEFGPLEQQLLERAAALGPKDKATKAKP